MGMYCSHFSLTIVPERRIYVQHSVAVKKPNANAGDTGDTGSIPGSGRSPRGGNAIHFSILAWENPWKEKPHRLQSMGVAKSWTRLSDKHYFIWD